MSEIHYKRNTLLCAVFHHIRTIEECKFIDKVDGREVGQFECVKCGTKFMANKKRSWFRVYIRTTTHCSTSKDSGGNDMSDKKQTAVEWLAEKMMHPQIHNPYIEQALEMEKQQIAKSVQWCLSGVMDEESALNEGYKFYNEAFQRAYGVDEPDYNNITIRNPNPDYKP